MLVDRDRQIGGPYARSMPRASLRRGYLCSAVALGLVLLGLAGAASSSALRAVQPRGAAGCIDAGGSEGCARAVSLSEGSSLGPLAISPNGRFLYVVDNLNNGSSNVGRLLVFARNRRSGALRQLPGRRGCLQNTFTPVRHQHGPCRLIGGIERPSEIAISPDGRRLYAATWGEFGSYLVTFALDSRRGDARPLQCLTNVTPSSCAAAPLSAPYALMVSPDSRFIYIGSLSEFAVGPAPLLRVYRAAARGLIAQQCLAEAAIHDLGCTAAPMLGRGAVQGLAQAPGGGILYASSSVALGEHRIVALARDPASGQLAPLAASGDCVSNEPAPPASCLAVALTGSDLEMSPAAGTLYAAGEEVGGAGGTFGVAALTRDPATGALSEPAGPAGCVVSARASIAGCGALPSWAERLQLPARSPAPDVLLAGLDAEGAILDTIVQITREPSTGALVAGDVRGCQPAVCVSPRGTQSTANAAITSSPDGRSLYLADGPGLALLQVVP
jgi:hypothetical protein